MADINDLLKSKKVQSFQAKKRRPWDNMTSEATPPEKKEEVKPTEDLTTKTKKLNRDGPTRPWQENSKKDSLSETPSSALIKQPKMTSTETNHSPMEEDVKLKKSSPASNMEEQKKSDQSRTNIGPESNHNNVKQEQVSDHSRTYVEPMSNQNKEKAKQSVGWSDIDSNQSRTRIEPVSDQVNSDIVPESDQSRTYIGSKTNTKNLRTIDLESNQYRTRVEPMSDHSRTKIDSKKDHSRTSVVPGFESESDQNLIHFLPKLHRRIVSFLVQNCVARGSRTTPPITYDLLAQSVETTTDSAKTQVKRLEKKGFIIRIQNKMGPSSWTIYEIPLNVYQQVIEIENMERLTSQKNLLEEYVGPGRGPSRGPEGSSSSNIYNNITTNTEESDQWNQIIIPEFLKRHGFSVTHAKQVLGDKENRLSFEQVQDSFNNFAIDLENNKVTIKTNPIRYFMSVIRSQRVPYESAFVTEQSRLEVEEYLKRVRSEVEICKQKAQVELVMKFKEWMSSLTQEQKNEIIKPNEMIKEGSHLQELQLRAYYQKLNGIDL